MAPLLSFPSLVVAFLLCFVLTRAISVDFSSSAFALQLNDGVHDIGSLVISVSYETEDRLHLLITDAGRSRWEVPQHLMPREDAGTGQTSSNPKLKLVYTVNPFSLVVSRVSNGEVLFDAQRLVFDEQYLEISTTIPSSASLYGLGESTRSTGFRLSRNSSTYTMWTADTSAASTDVNLYGAYPFYVDVRKNGATHGVLLLNSNGMDVVLDGNKLTYKVIGGAFEFYFFAGPSPLEVIQQYTDVVGKPAPMPYWSLGYHQCRWGYKNVSELKKVVEGYKKAKLPLEVMWVDIDYMDAYKDFTLDPVNFPQEELRPFVDQLHENGQRFVLIVDPGIKPESNYSTYERGIALNIFINDSRGKPYLGQVWPGPVHFPDFLHPKTADFWSEEIRIFHDLVGFDGLWIDMNEASNFCTGTICSLPSNGTCPSTTCCLSCDTDNLSKWDRPPYAINNGASRNLLGVKAIPTSAKHYGGVLEYNVHNLYGFAEAKITYNALKATSRNKRPFILSRSSFVGGGSVAAHWTGDNAATWNDLKYSIVSILNSGLFGIPMVGADICGFSGDTTEELCNRWIQLGAFYPFSRNHNVRTAISQELYLWDSVTRSAAKALELRYQLLPYFYTLHYEAHTTGSPVARPLFFSFPGDETALGIDQQFLLGSGIMVSPVLQSNTTSLRAYFPAGTWFNLFDYSKIVSNGSYLRLGAAKDSINVHVYQGNVIPMQRPGSTTSAVRKSPFTLLVAFGETKKSATGQVFLDDGERPKLELEAGFSTLITFRATATRTITITGSVTHEEYTRQQNFILNRLIILGVNSQPRNLKINGRVATSSVKTNVSQTAVKISGLQVPLATDFKISFEQNPRFHDTFSRAEQL